MAKALRCLEAIKRDGLQCPENFPVGCAVSVSGFIASMFWLASYLSLAGSSCAEAINSNGLCGADWMALVADFAEVANAGASVRQDCDLGLRKDWLALLSQPADKVEPTAVQKVAFLDQARWRAQLRAMGSRGAPGPGLRRGAVCLRRGQ